MQPEKWTLDNISFAQKHLLILSGLYGVLKPFDLISSYRLEMGIKYSFLPDYANLYNWRPLLTKYMNDFSSNSPIINLASKEYSDALNLKELNANFINCHF